MRVRRKASQMNNQADQILKRIFGQEQVKILSHEALRKMRNDIERMVQERGKDVAEAHIRKAQATLSRQAQHPVQAGQTSEDQRRTFESVGAAALMMATISEALRSHHDPLDTEMDLEGDGNSQDEQNPFFIKDPRPGWA